eukprot:GHVU01153066.1.p1 GENE.GHVU01153066.1~~GHVU01153066.1.p1  ORF type:complete len:345 (-),score=36.45 GHVU01153066.1:649-1683(-)
MWMGTAYKDAKAWFESTKASKGGRTLGASQKIEKEGVKHVMALNKAATLHGRNLGAFEALHEQQDNKQSVKEKITEIQTTLKDIERLKEAIEDRARETDAVYEAAKAWFESTQASKGDRAQWLPKEIEVQGLQHVMALNEAATRHFDKLGHFEDLQRQKKDTKQAGKEIAASGTILKNIAELKEDIQKEAQRWHDNAISWLGEDLLMGIRITANRQEKAAKNTNLHFDLMKVDSWSDIAWGVNQLDNMDALIRYWKDSSGGAIRDLEAERSLFYSRSAEILYITRGASSERVWCQGREVLSGKGWHACPTWLMGNGPDAYSDRRGCRCDAGLAFWSCTPCDKSS